MNFKDLSWLDLDPLPQQQDVGVDVGHVPFGPGESSQVAQAQAPHIEDQDVDDGSESKSEAFDESDPENSDHSDDQIVQSLTLIFSIGHLEPFC